MIKTLKKYGLVTILALSQVASHTSLVNGMSSTATNETSYTENAIQMLLSNGFDHDEFFQNRIDIISDALENSFNVWFIGEIILIQESLQTTPTSTRVAGHDLTLRMTANYFGNLPPISQNNSIFPLTFFHSASSGGWTYTGTMFRTGTPSWTESVPGSRSWVGTAIYVGTLTR